MYLMLGLSIGLVEFILFGVIVEGGCGFDSSVIKKGRRDFVCLGLA